MRYSVVFVLVCRRGHQHDFTDVDEAERRNGAACPICSTPMLLGTVRLEVPE